MKQQLKMFQCFKTRIWLCVLLNSFKIQTIKIDVIKIKYIGFNFAYIIWGLG